MQALNEAKVIKERYPEIDIQIFFLDLQCSGKGWEQFCETAKDMGVTCKRFRVPALYEEGESVYINYAEDTLITEEVDMVVLSVGISPPRNTFGLPRNEFGFPEKNACGFFSHPQDITESVEEALASISRIPGNPPHVPVETPEPGVQVFLCPCGKDLVSLAEGLEREYSVHVIDHLCSDKGIKQFVRTIKREKIVIGGCSLHENLFKRLAREKGISFVEVVPLREMRWIAKPQKDLLKMAITKLEHLDTSKIEKTQIKIVPEVIVIGGGVSGLTAALELADTYRVYLVEKDSHLGGRALNIEYSLDYSPQKITEDLIKEVEAHSRITVLKNTEITGLTGYGGNYYVKTNHGEINCGAVIVAVGADEYAHGYDHPKIITQTELEERILKDDIPNLIVMVQCIGSRNDENPWCSAVCCSKAVSNSLKILEKSDSQILILYKDMRTYGFQDAYYRKAREKGVLFLQNDEIPSIIVDNSVSVVYTDCVLNTKIRIEPDLLVLSTGIVPKKEGSDLAEMLNISLDQNGFFKELHPKFYPVDSTREGIFICGLCHSPQNVKESIIQAKAAASRVRTFLTAYREDYTKVMVRDEVCTGCSTCVYVCPFRAISLRTKNEKKVATIDMSICKDCGLCVGSCPVTALYQTTLSDEQILSMVIS